MKYLLATSAYSNPDLLEKCILSFPKIDNLKTAIYFDGYYYEKIFKDLFSKNIFEQTIDYVLKPDVPNHIGCSASWNKFVKLGFEDNDFDYLIVVGSDTYLHKGFIEAIIRDLEHTHIDFGTGINTSFNCWLMNRNCFNNVGYWDENFFPAYYEDHDYHFRVVSAGMDMRNVGDYGLFEHYGSATIKTNESRNQANHITFVKNREYLHSKWNGDIFTKNNFITPFNNPNLTLKDWTILEPDYTYKKTVWEKLEHSLNK